MSFKDDFLKSKPGKEREELVFKAITSQGPPKNLVPVTVTTPEGVKITYSVMPDYVTVDGIRVPMAGQTAQRVADYFGMKLPTSKITKQIYNAADTKLTARPMSAGGIIDGKTYTGQQVVDTMIGDPRTSIAYNDRIKQDLNGKNPTLVAGHMKDIVAPERSGKLSLHGLYGPDGKPIQSSELTPHDITGHTEYASGARLVSDKVVITMPDGSKVTTTMDDALSNPKYSKYLSTTPGVKRYDLPEGKSQLVDKEKAKELKVDQLLTKPDIPKVIAPPSKGVSSLLEKTYNALKALIN